jgi:dTDP-glucose 4,6-dehydratase
VKGDVASADLVRFVMEAERVDTVMHFAAQTHVDNSFGNSLAFTVRVVVGWSVGGEGRGRRGVGTTGGGGGGGGGGEGGGGGWERPPAPPPPGALPSSPRGEKKEKKTAPPPARAKNNNNAQDTRAPSPQQIPHPPPPPPPPQQMGNTYGTHVLLECARVYGGVRRFINVSTDEVYGETSLGKDRGLREESVLEPTNPYSAAKAGAEMMAKAYLTSYKLPVIVTRGNNVYGPHQFPEKMIPKFTLLASRGAPLPIHGDGQSVRSYLFVEDVAAAFETILFKGTVGEVYNIGTQKERSVLSVAADIARHFDPSADPAAARTFVRDRAFNDRRYFICDKKLLALGWREQVGWEEGLERTIKWYKEVGGKRSYWENGDMDAALAPHPTLQQAGLMPGSGHGSLAGGGAGGSGGGGGGGAGGGASSSLGGGSDGSGSGGGGMGGRVPSFIAGGKAAAAGAATKGAAVSLSAAAGAAAEALGRAAVV